jgi:hypothetical protein
VPLLALRVLRDKSETFSDVNFRYVFDFIGRSGEIRTHDPCLPKTVLYQAELHSDRGGWTIPRYADLQDQCWGTVFGLDSFRRFPPRAILTL